MNPFLIFKILPVLFIGVTANVLHIFGIYRLFYNTEVTSDGYFNFFVSTLWSLTILVPTLIAIYIVSNVNEKV